MRFAVLCGVSLGLAGCSDCELRADGSVETKGYEGLPVVWSSEGDEFTATVMNGIAQAVLPTGPRRWEVSVDGRCTMDAEVDVPTRIELVSPQDGDRVPEAGFVASVRSPTGDTVLWRADDLRVASTELVDGMSQADILLPLGPHDMEVRIDGGFDSIVFSVEVDAAPSVNLACTRLPSVGEELSCTASSEDDDVVGYQWSWTQNGRPTPFDTGVLDPAILAAGDVWDVEVRALDGVQTGPPATQAFTILAPPPPVVGAEVMPTEPHRGDVALCVIETDPPGQDVARVDVSWTLNGVDAGTGRGLYLADVRAGDVVQCVVESVDTSATSNAVTVGNSAPRVDSVVIDPPAPEAGEALSCEAVASDADGDAVTLSYAWSRDGVLLGTDSTLTAPDDPGLVLCEVFADDGTVAGPSTTRSALIWDAAWSRNVLVIIADDMGVEQFDPYGVGTTPPPTPNLDALAAESLRFDRAWSSPVCSPSRANMMTGQYGRRLDLGVAVKVNSDEPSLSLDEVTLPEQVISATAVDYRFGAFGKWHLTSLVDGAQDGPNLHGFDWFSGSMGNLNNGSAYDGFTSNYYDWEHVLNGDIERVDDAYVTTRTVDDAMGWIADQDQAWFAWVALHAPHGPYNDPPADLHTQDLTASTPQERYDAIIEAMDTELGRLLELVGDDATIVFVGDNGTPQIMADTPYSSARSKRSVYEGGIRVPFLVRAPFMEGPGQTSSLVHFVDLFPTLSHIMGAPVDDLGAIDGVDFMEILFDPSRMAREDAYSERFSPNGSGVVLEEDDKTMRDERFKLIRRMDGAEEFYDLGEDWAEGDDLLTLGQELSEEAVQARARLAHGISAIAP